MTDLDLQIDENNLEIIRENEKLLKEKWDENLFTRFDGKFIEKEFTSDDVGLNYKLAHGLGWVPKDIVVASMQHLDLPAIGEGVFFRADVNSAQSLNSGSTVKLEFNDNVYDTHGGWATDTYTVQYTGYYKIKVTALVTPCAMNDGENITLQMYVNGATSLMLYYHDSDMPAASSQVRYRRVAGEVSIYLDKGDTVDVRLMQISGTNETMYNSVWYNRISIERVPQDPVTFNYASFDSTHLDLNIWYPCTVRMWVGSYLEATQ